MKQHIAVLLAVLLVWTQTPAQSAEERTRETAMEVSWQGLPGVVAGKKVMLIMPDGAELRGDVLAVESSQLVLNVKKTSDKRSHPKGRTEIPRASVTTLSFSSGGHGWSIAGATIGLLGGCAIAAPVAVYSENEDGSASAATVAIVAGAAVGGYFLGRSADRKTITIRVKD